MEVNFSSGQNPLYGAKENALHDYFQGEFILASSKEVFHLPNNISAEYKLKSQHGQN